MFAEFLYLLFTLLVLKGKAFRSRASLVGQMGKNLPAVQETQVWSLGQEDTLEKGMATHSNILFFLIYLFLIEG